MAKQLNVDMRFTADTSKARQALAELQTSIQKLGYGTAGKDVIDPAKFQQASAAARELAQHLNNAFDARTGNLDLSKLNASLKSSGTSLSQLTANFSSAGKVGQEAFLSVAKAVANADLPVLSVNKGLNNLLVTLKNTARFQISSSLIHGFIGGIQSAYGYAQDLNESLNNIRIVTGQSTEQMARFAKQANEAARGLSATTLDYTNASLIYYQQGLDDEAVAARTETTLKLANVSRQSAEEVSNQMTAIWNNFAEGSTNLEYYADVITALGAATASSSEEIAGGLEKFASVANTIGLSYEYAASALATIVATTRQSEDTVGTGLRTLFARFEGLSLGQTLDDGTTLNKYSKALASVGVNIKDQHDELKSMDQILNELGERWQTLSKEQQIALAQTVGGVRQYTNLVALMDNWDYFQQNVGIASGSSGTLQEQADIYAESWEAAQKRVKAAAESLFDTLINDDFFIELNNVFETILIGINKFTENFGGVKSLLVSALSFVLTMVADKIQPAVQGIIQNFQILTGQSDKVYASIQQDFQKSITDFKSKVTLSDATNAELEGSQRVLAMKSILALNGNLTEAERLRYASDIDGQQLLTQEIQNHIKELEKLKEQVAKLEEAETKAKESFNAAHGEKIAKLKEEQTARQNELNEAQKAQEIAEQQQQAIIEQNKRNAQNKVVAQQITTSNLEQQNIEAQNAYAQATEKRKQAVIEATAAEENFKRVEQEVLQQRRQALQEQAAQQRNVLLNQDLDQTNSRIRTEQYSRGAEDHIRAYAADRWSSKGKQASVFNDFKTQFKELEDTAARTADSIRKILIERLSTGGSADISSQLKSLFDFDGLKNMAVNSLDIAKDEVSILKQGLGNLTTSLPGVKAALAEIDKSDSVEAFATGIDRLRGACENASIASDKLKVGLGQIGIDQGNLSEYLLTQKELNTVNEKTIATDERVKQAADQLSEAKQKAINATNDEMAAKRNAEAAAKEVAKAEEELMKAMEAEEAVKAKNGKTGSEYEKAAKAVANAEKDCKAKTEALTKATQALNDAQRETVETDERVKTATEKLAEARKKQAEEANELARLQQTAQSMMQEFNPTHQVAGLEALTASAAMVGNIVTAYNSVAAAIRTIGDESATTGQKIASLGMAFSMMIPTIKSGFSNFGKIAGWLSNSSLLIPTKEIQEGTKAIQGFALAEDLLKNKQTASLGVTQFFNLALKETGIQMEINKRADLEAAIRQEMSTGATFEAALAKAAENGMIDENTLKKLLNAKATRQATLESLKFKAANIELIAILAAIAVVVGAIVLAYRAWKANTPEGQLEAANKKLEEQKEAADKARQAWQDLQSTISNYDSAAKALSELNAGTEEFYNQLVNTNEAARELIQTLGLTYGNGFTIGEKGELIINKDSQEYEDAIKEQRGETQEASDSELLASLDVQAKQRKVDESNFINKYGLANKEFYERLINGEKLEDFSDADLKALEDNYRVNYANQLVEDSLGNITFDQAMMTANMMKVNPENLVSSEVLSEYTRLFSKTSEEAQNESAKKQIQAQLQQGLAMTSEAYQQAVQNGLGKTFDISDEQVKAVLDAETDEAKKNALANISASIEQQAQTANEEYAKAQALDERFGNGEATNLYKALKSNDFSEYSRQELLDISQNKDLRAAMLNTFGEDFDVSAGFEQLNEQIKNWVPPVIDLSNLAEGINTVQEIINGLDFGDKLKKNDYATLLENLGDEVSQFFTELTDGSAIFTGDTTEFQDFVQQKAIEEYQNASNSINEFYNGYNRIVQSNGGSGGGGKDHGGPISQPKFNDINLLDEFRSMASEDEYSLSDLASKLGFNTNNEEAGQDFRDLVNGFINGLLGEGTAEKAADEEELLNILQQAIDKYDILIEQHDKAGEAIARTATSVGNLQDIAADSQLSAEALNEGYKTLALTTDEGKEAFKLYSRELKAAGNNQSEVQKVTEKFQKTIKDIQANKAAKNIREMYENFDNLTDLDFSMIAEQLQTVFGKEITKEFVKNHKDWVEQWLNGSEEQRQAAANMIDNFNGLQGALNQFNETTINTPEGLSYLQNQLEANSWAATQFATHFSQLKQLLETGVTEIDGMTFHIDGTANFEDIFNKVDASTEYLTEVATRIKELGNSTVDFEVDGSNIPAPPNLAEMGIDEVVEWLKGLNGTSIKVRGSGEWSAKAGIPQMTSGGSGGGGGGGGGKTKSKEKKDPTDERDRYHTITEKIQDATDAYDELSKAEDRAFGKERIEAMEGITDNLKLQIELQKQYLDEIRNYLEGDRAAVEALGATFDVNGVITNYDDLIAELVAKYNEGVDAFNNGGLDEDAFKEQYEEPFNKAKEAIDQYVETINLLQSEELNLIDLQNDLADQFREIAAYKLELHIDLDEDELKYLDFLLEMLGKNAEDAVDRLDLLGQQFNTNRDEIAAYTTAIQDLLRLRGFTDEDVAAFIRGELTAGDLEERGFTTDDIDKLREYRDAIQDNTTAMNDLAKEIEESFLNTLDDLNEKVDDAEERFEHFAAMLEHFHNVVDIVGQDALGMSAETMKLLAKAAKENAIEMVKAAKTQLDSLNAVRAQAQAQLDAALEAQKNASTAEEKLRADEAVRYWSDTISEVTNRVEQAEEDLADALENALEGIQEMYTTMIEQATKEFERSVTGAAGSLEQLQKNFDRQKETQDLYIPTYEKIYELTKLTRDINNSIDDTDNLWSKQELAKLQDEINQKMEDGVELTEHDVEELRKRYELKLAEAALEEAQDAKRTVRMSRDNEGNWSYVYTADENDVAEAEQNYEDKLYEYQQMNYEYIQDLQANIIQAQQDMADAINDLDAASFASQEEYLAEVQRIRDAAMAKISQYRDQLAQTLDQQGILYEEDWKRYNELTGYRMARDDQWVDNWNETILAQETGFETLEDMFDQITGAIGGPDEPGTYVGDITDAYAEMQASNERALNAAGTSMQTYEQDTVDAISGIDQQIEETQNQVDEFTNSMTETMEGVSDFIGEWKNQYGEAVKSITEFNKDLYNSCNTLIKKLQDTYGVNADFEAAQAEAAAEALATSQRGNSSENGNPSENNYFNNNNSSDWNNNFKQKTFSYYKYESLGNNYHRRIAVYSDNSTADAGVEDHSSRRDILGGNTQYASLGCSLCGQVLKKIDYKTSPSSGRNNQFKSGGYTGTWSAASARTGMYTGSWNGPDLEENGRLAFLHQKELVLNASDTENFLSAVDMVRQISQTIDLQAASRSNGWNFLLPGILGREPDTLDQNVHIEAHFPNVTSHSEIEEAFTNLVGKASQFANR